MHGRRVAADKEQVDRAREVADPADFYAPVSRPLPGRSAADRGRDRSTRCSPSPTPRDVWLDVGAGGGRYALPLALAVREVVAIDPSPAMLGALREDAAANGIANVRVIEARWPMADPPHRATSR